MNTEHMPPTVTYKEMVAKWMQDPEFQAERERMEHEEYAILDEMLAARRAAGLYRAKAGERMGTRASPASGKHSPRIGALRKFAKAMGERMGNTSITRKRRSRQ